MKSITVIYMLEEAEMAVYACSTLSLVDGKVVYKAVPSTREPGCFSIVDGDGQWICTRDDAKKALVTLENMMNSFG